MQRTLEDRYGVRRRGDGLCGRCCNGGQLGPVETTPIQHSQAQDRLDLGGNVNALD